MSAHPESIFRTPVIQGLISRFAPNVTPYSELYGVGPRSSGMLVSPIPETNRFMYEVFDNTRKIAQLGAPMNGPVKTFKAPSRLMQMSLLSADNYIDFDLVDYLGFRQLGKGFDTLDTNGQQRVAKQIANYLQRHHMLHEWCFSAMFRNALYLKVDTVNGGYTVLPTSTGADITITFGLPDSHAGQLALGSGGADLVTATFAAAGTDIPGIIRNIFAVSHRESGYGFSRLICSNKVAETFFNNTAMKNQAGTSYRVFDGITLQGNPQTVPAQDGGTMARSMSTKGYYTVQWRALGGMEFTMHVVDSGVDFGVAGSDETAAANFYRCLPENDLLMLPDTGKGSFFEKFEGKTLKQKDPTSRVMEIQGFDMITYRKGGFNETPGQRVQFVDKFAYGLTIPRAVYRPTVIF